MRRSVIAGIVVILTVSGCASMKASPTIPTPRPAASPSEPDSSTNSGSGQVSAPDKPPEAPAPPQPPPPVSTATSSSPAPAKSSPATRPVKQTGTAAVQPRPPAVQTTTSDKPPTPTPTPSTATPTLNLADLEQRLRDTRAIGVFTKLSLKNQVDDLLGAFRALYQGPNKHPPAELRQRYDLLLLKVLTLLQDGDPPLAAAIASSREAIWSILADPDKFARI